MEEYNELGPAACIPEDILQTKLGGCGKGVKIYRGCRIADPERVYIGDRSQLDEGVRIFPGQGVWIGKFVHLAFGASISGGGICKIGDFVSIGAGVRIITGSDLVDGSGLTNPTIPQQYRAVRRSYVEIEPHAVVFTGAIILPGVRIGEGAVVGAGAVVHRDLKPWTIYVGAPLVAIGKRPKEKILMIATRLLKDVLDLPQK